MRNSLFNRLDKLAESPRYSVYLLLLLSLLFYIGIGQVHLFDWDEINFAESAREMMESGDYLRVQINFQPFWEKPPFFFWLQVVSMKLFGINEFAARFPNALLGFIYMVTLYFIGKKHFNGKFGLLWALLFTASLLPHVYFKSGIIDPLFNFFIFLSIYFMAVALKNKDEKSLLLYALLSGIFSGLSVFTKGPVGFLLLGMTLFIYLVIDRFKSFPSIRKILFFLVGFIFVVGCWISLEVAQNGWSIIKQFIAYQTELFNRPVAGHAQPFYYHFVVVFFGCFPMSIIALPMLLKKQTSDNPINFVRWSQILFWGVIILFSVVTTKIIHYSSMTYLPLSFLAAYQLYHFGLSKKLRFTYIVVGLLISLLLFAVPYLFVNKEHLYSVINDQFTLMALKYGPKISWLHLFYFLPFVIGVFIGLKWIKQGDSLKFGVSAFLSTGVTFALIMLFFLPRVEQNTQGAGIDFAQKVSEEDCYFDAIGYKSYIPYFYGKIPYREHEKSRDLDWLIDGDIDKPVYFLSRYDYTFLESRPAFKKVKEGGGFILWKREPNQ